VKVDLTTEEKDLLITGVTQWGGPTSMTDKVAAVLGFENASAFYATSEELRRRVEHGELSPTDVRCVLLATELVFASDVVGAGVEWEAVAGVSDADTIRLLRGLQRKLIKVYAAKGP
jgi:hypothetical protein